MEVGIEEVLDHVGDGWHPLVRKLIQDCYAAGWNGELVQIKEKFGGLRFYINEGNDAVTNLIDEAEHKSVTICEECSLPGKQRGNGWIRTLCDKHNEE